MLCSVRHHKFMAMWIWSLKFAGVIVVGNYNGYDDSVSSGYGGGKEKDMYGHGGPSSHGGQGQSHAGIPGSAQQQRFLHGRVRRLGFLGCRSPWHWLSLSRGFNGLGHFETGI